MPIVHEPTLFDPLFAPIAYIADKLFDYYYRKIKKYSFGEKFLMMENRERLTALLEKKGFTFEHKKKT